MTAIHKGKKKLKTTMNDIKNEKFAKQGSGPSIFMGENIPHIPNIQANALITKKKEEDIQKRVDTLNEELNLVKGYNLTIDDFAPCYKSFIPMDDILVRVFLKEPKESDSGLWLPTHSASDIVELKRRAGSGDRYTQGADVTPFTFSTQAVIVNIPPFLEEDPRFERGNIITIKHLRSDGVVLNDNSVIIDYQHSFVHPEYGDTTPPRDFKSEHFGYALIPRGIVRGYNKEDNPES